MFRTGGRSQLADHPVAKDTDLPNRTKNVHSLEPGPTLVDMVTTGIPSSPYQQGLGLVRGQNIHYPLAPLFSIQKNVSRHAQRCIPANTQNGHHWSTDVFQRFFYAAEARLAPVTPWWECTLSPTHNHDNSPSSPDTLGAASQAKTAEKPETALDNANADRNAVPENSGKPQTEENQAEVENGSVWVTQQRRRRQVQDRSRPALSGASRGDDQRPRSKGLHGARSVQCCALHLSHISLESKVEDVLTHCRQRRVNVAGCFFIRSRNWGTQSAKIFVADSFVDDVLKEGFWPEMIECRRWESMPPRRSRARLSDNQ